VAEQQADHLLRFSYTGRSGEEDLAEDKGVAKVLCDNCGYMMLLDAETLGIRGLWEEVAGF